jgi:hypothetical protein
VGGGCGGVVVVAFHEATGAIPGVIIMIVVVAVVIIIIGGGGGGGVAEACERIVCRRHYAFGEEEVGLLVLRLRYSVIVTALFCASSLGLGSAALDNYQLG